MFAAALPPELMAEILCRLPVKVLLQIRCVSKQWRRFIDSSYFIETHLNRSIKARENQLLILSNYSSHDVKSVDFEFLETTFLRSPLEPRPVVQERYGPRLRIKRRESLSDLHQIIVPRWGGLRRGQRGEVKVWGSCNGLVLISNSYSTGLWNPSTRKHHNLPELLLLEEDNHHLPSSSSSVRPPDFYGFGYDSSRDDYKVIQIVMRKANYRHQQVWVYSLQSNSWTQVGKNFPLITKCHRQPGVLIREALHWRVKAKSELNDVKNDFILSFDLKTDEYRMIPFSQPECQNAQFHSRLGAFNGSSLCLIYSYLPAGFEIWVMEQGESWTRVTLQRGDFICYPGGFIYATLRHGKEVLLNRNFFYTSGLFCPTNAQEVYSEIFHELTRTNSDVCMVSLVSPHGGAASAQRNE